MQLDISWHRPSTQLVYRVGTHLVPMNAHNLDKYPKRPKHQHLEPVTAWFNTVPMPFQPAISMSSDLSFPHELGKACIMLSHFYNFKDISYMNKSENTIHSPSFQLQDHKPSNFGECPGCFRKCCTLVFSASYIW